MSAELLTRVDALAAADRVCPRCSAARERDQDYCIGCGLRLPPVAGPIAWLRRVWIRRVGWYPGDWLWPALLTFVVATAGATAAVAVTQVRAAGSHPTFVATGAVPAPRPRTPAGGTAAGARPGETPTGRNGSLVWPAERNGWTVVLTSYPQAGGLRVVRAAAAHAVDRGLKQVGIIDSSNYASLTPGYYVVFVGVYGSETDAAAALVRVRSAGFPGAYTRPVAR